jgi:hypothetical protein
MVSCFELKKNFASTENEKKTGHSRFSERYKRHWRVVREARLIEKFL